MTLELEPIGRLHAQHSARLPPTYGIRRLAIKAPYSPAVHPWSTMKVGSVHFVAVGNPRYRAEKRQSLLSLANRWARRNAKPWRFSSKLVWGGVQIVRVA